MCPVNASTDLPERKDWTQEGAASKACHFGFAINGLPQEFFELRDDGFRQDALRRAGSPDDPPSEQDDCCNAC